MHYPPTQTPVFESRASRLPPPQPGRRRLVEGEQSVYLQIRVPESMRAALRDAANRNVVSVSWIVRRAIERELGL